MGFFSALKDIWKDASVESNELKRKDALSKAYFDDKDTKRMEKSTIIYMKKLKRNISD